jgi:two-component system cell cycle sensor histidine kinase/response regulator CckA
VNLAVNARDAMPSGGTLRVSLDTMGVDGGTHPGRQWLRPGRYVRLVIADTGHGMDAVTKAHAFQPFFTTKTMGSGRGLGLATVYGIVKQSNGFVWVESSVGNGATFTLLFPALDTAGAVSADGVAAAASEGILIVEPDEQFRTFAGAALRRRGYTVLLAASVTEAIELFASHPFRVHLLVADAGAQTMEGLALAARLKAIDPMLQSLVVLGAGAQSTAAPGVLPTTPVIQKPFTLQALAEKVRSVLDSGEGRG